MSLMRVLPIPVFIYLLMVVLPVRFMIGSFQMTGLRFYLIVMMIPLLIMVLRRKPALPDILLPIFVGWVWISMSFNTPAQAFQHTGAMFIELIGGYFMARCYIRSAEQFRAMIATLVLLVLCTLPLALVEAGTGAPALITLIRAIPGISSVEVVDIPTRLGLERVQAVFAHPIHFGLFCSTAVSLLFVGLSENFSRVTRTMGAALVVLTAFLALSSGAFLSVLIQLFLIGWLAFFRTNPWKWWLLAVAGVAAYVFVDLVSNRSPVRVFFSYATFSAHNAYWRSLIFEWGMVNVWSNPVFGLGLNEWERPHYMYSGSMDNFWLSLAVRYGLPGFALMSIAWISGVGRVMLAATGQSPLRYGWAFCMLGLTFTLATVHIWTAIYSFTFFLLAAGQWMAEQSARASDYVPMQSRENMRPIYRRPRPAIA